MKLTLRLAKKNVFGGYPVRRIGDRKKKEYMACRHLLAIEK
jgi:hypothetical protein